MVVVGVVVLVVMVVHGGGGGGVHWPWYSRWWYGGIGVVDDVLW